MFRKLSNRRRILLAIAAITTLLSVAVVTFGWFYRQAGKRQELLDIANAAERAGDWRSVESALRRYLHLAGNDVETCLRIGDAIEQGAISDQDRMRALPFYTKALALDPRCDEARLQFADLLIDDNPLDAVKHASQVMPKQPDNPDALRIKALGLARLTLRRDEAADRLLETHEALISALDHQPGHVKLAMAAAEFRYQHAVPLAVLLDEEEDDVQRAADAALANLVEHASDEAEARLARLMLRRRFGMAGLHDAVSRADLQRLVVLRPSSNVVRLLAAGWSTRQAFPAGIIQNGNSTPGDPQAVSEARSHLSAAMENRANDPVPYWSLAQLQWWCGEREAALETLESGRESTGEDNLILSLRLAETQMALGQWDGARCTLQQLDELASPRVADSSPTKHRYQPMVGAQRDPVGGEPDLRPVIDLLWAQWYLSVENPAVDPSRALALLDRYVNNSLQPGLRGLASYLRGVALASLGRWDEAAEVLERCARMTSITVLPRLAAARCLYRLGRYRDASAQYRHALSLLAQRPQPELNVNQVWIELARCLLADQSQQPVWKREWRSFDRALAGVAERMPNSPIPLFLDLEADLLRESSDVRVDTMARLKQAQQEFDDSPEFWQLLAGYFLRARQPSAAIKAIEAWERISGQTDHTLRAELALATGQIEQADESWAAIAAEQTAHRQQQLLTLRVQAAIEHGRMLHARRLLENWLMEHPSDRQKQFQMAQLAWAEGDQAALQRAADVLEQGAEGLDRLSAIARTQSLLLSVAQNPTPATRQQLSRTSSDLVSAYPDDRQIAVLEALVAETRGDTRGAVKAWRRAIRLGEQAPDSRLRLAALLHDQGESREALELCLSTASSVRDCRRATLAARILVSPTVDPVARRYAEDLFRETLSGPAPADLPRFLMELALLREYQGQPDQAIALTEQALRLQPKAVELKNNLAWFLAAYRGDHTTALQWIEQAIKAVGPLPALLDTKGVILLEAGKANEAVAILETSVQVPTPPAVRLLHLAEAYHRAGRTDDAGRLLERVESQSLTRLSPRDRDTLLRLKVQS